MFLIIVIFIALYFVQDFLAYRIIRRIDKHERKKLNRMEEEHIKYMLEKTAESEAE